MAISTGLARQLDEDVWLLDTRFQGEPGVIASYLLTGPAGPALVDVGSAASVETLLAGVREAGVNPSDVRHLVLTHIHLDHAGAAGTLLRAMPNARVYVHSLGAPHLVDPSKLLASAARIYGDKMEQLWGTIEPLPADRVVVLDEGSAVAAGGRTLRALYTPGHAVHHVAFHDAAHDAVFAGDVAGVRLEGVGYVRPPTPPPDLNLEDWFASINRLAALRPERLYLPHFGAVTSVPEHLEQLRDHLASWGELTLSGLREGLDDAALAARLARASDPDVAREAGGAGADAVKRYELATNYLMSAQGYVRYYRKHHPELLPAR